MPRYLHGKFFTVTLSGCRISSIQPYTTDWHSRDFGKVGREAGNIDNMSRLCLIIDASQCKELMKRAAYLAYIEARMTILFPGSFKRVPSEVASYSIHSSESMPKMNKKGERGSPWRSPWQWITKSKTTPLIRNWEDEKARIMAIHSVQPLACLRGTAMRLNQRP
jgi:hypothetical protein